MTKSQILTKRKTKIIIPILVSDAWERYSKHGMTADKLCFNTNNLCILVVENVYFTPLNSVGYIV